MFERYDAGEQAVLVHIHFLSGKQTSPLEEFVTLVTSAGIEILNVITIALRRPHPKYFVGVGKAQEIAEVVKSTGASVILFGHTLFPAQERNLEKLCECRVIDRTGLILDIFAQRARTSEGKLQVELAQLNYLATRLVRGWTHLERQKGGIGLRGPGEMQLETDRRLLRARVQMILSRLKKVETQREQGRKARMRAEIPTVSLVGYTNAGKSTLFNRLTNEAVYVADQLFATLDPTMRRIQVENTSAVVLADTVGFIRDLPHDLIAAFKATLQETRQASLLLHVVDAADRQLEEHIAAVEGVLAELGADSIPVLLVMNKIDQLSAFEPRIDRDVDQVPIRVWLSAEKGKGIELLLQALSEHLSARIEYYRLCLPPTAAGKLRSKLHKLRVIEQEMIDQDGNIIMTIRISSTEWQRLCSQEQELRQFIV